MRERDEAGHLGGGGGAPAEPPRTTAEPNATDPAEGDDAEDVDDIDDDLVHALIDFLADLIDPED